MKTDLNKSVALLSSFLLIVQVAISIVIVTRLNTLDQHLNNLSSAQASSNGQSQGPVHVDNISIEGSPFKGTKGTPITLVEFSDYECPFCQQATKVIDDILRDYPNKIFFVHKDFPLETIHPHAFVAAEAADCAGEQNQYWPMHDLLFANHDKLTVVDFKQDAVQLNLNTAQFNTCLDGQKYATTIRLNMADGLGDQVNATPTFFVNGDRVVGGSADMLRQLIDHYLAKGGK